MLPVLVTVKATGPAGTVISDSRMVHSDSLALTAAGLPRGRLSATRAPASREADGAGGSRRSVVSHVLDPRVEVTPCIVERETPSPRAPIPWGINSPAGESSPDGCPATHSRTGLEPSELERFEAVMLPHLNAAYGLARSLPRNDADAEDVVQEAYLRALRYFGGFRGEGVGQSRAWVLTIVRNTASHLAAPASGGASATEFDETLHSEAAADEHPGRTLARSDARETLAQALDRLPPDLREVIVLREIEGLSYKEIGDVVDVPIGTVMSRLSRARKRLQDALDRLRQGALR